MKTLILFDLDGAVAGSQSAFSRVSVCVIRTNEEPMIAQHTLALARP